VTTVSSSLILSIKATLTSFSGTGHDLYLAESDGTEPRKLFTSQGFVVDTFWSPDGKSLRFTKTDSLTSDTSTLFEISAEGGEPEGLSTHRGYIFPSPAASDASILSGRWTPDGRYFLFLAARNGRADILAIRERRSFLTLRKPDPTQLTAGPIRYGSFAVSSDGKEIFTQGIELRGEVERYDRKSAQWIPLRPALSADCCAYSDDGQWMAYVTFPEGSLWRSKSDGSRRQQLTWPRMIALNPHWSPDGKEIAFSALSHGKTWKTFIIPAEGGKIRQLTESDCPELDANWSPDGKHLVFGTNPDIPSGTSCPVVLYTMVLKTHEISTIPGSEGLWSPRWSPDGKHIVALTSAIDALMIDEIASGKWSELVKSSTKEVLGFPQWSREGKLVYYWGNNAATVFVLRIIRPRNWPISQEFKGPAIRGIGPL
jgi:Tol biopolymer transport system component